MTLSEFKATLNNPQPNPEWDVQIQSLWFDAKGEWKKAHDLIDHLSDHVSSHVHAYLHRVEGDLWNSRYWYDRANQPEFKGSLEQERDYLLEKYLN